MLSPLFICFCNLHAHPFPRRNSKKLPSLPCAAPPPAGQSMEFASHSPATSADDVNDRQRFPDPPPPPPHGDPMLVIRDALLSQLQDDRLRQEIIVAELAKIERVMDLRSAAAEHATPVPFAFDEQFMTNGTRAVRLQRYVGVEKDLSSDSEEPASEDDLVSESWKTSSSTFDAAGDQENATSDDESKPQESSEAIPPKKTSSVKWSCAICHVEATSVGNLLQHFSGQKHRANILALEAKAKAERSRNATQCADQKPHPPWVCRFCQAKCTCESDLANHLNGKRHRANIQALLEECKSMAKDEEKPASVSICGICQVKWYCQTVMESHVGGKKHQTNFKALQLEAKRLGIVKPKMTRKREASPKWDCSICQVKCNSKSQFQDHCRSTGHVQREGTKKGASSEEMEKTLYFCKLCDLQCNSAKMLAFHRTGRKHLAKLNGC